MSKAKKRLLILACVSLVLLFLLGVALQGVPTGQDFLSALSAQDPLLDQWLPDAVAAGLSRGQTDPDYRLQDRASLYNLDNLGEVTTLLVEVHETGKGRSLAVFENPAGGAAEVRLPALVREGTERGTVKWGGFGGNAVAANATLEVRGEPRQNRKYHNFKIRLENAAGQYEGQSILNLKKAYGKPCKVEEKFAFDLFSTLPDSLSLRTRFVQLYIKDMSAQNPGYDNYGLYTLVEQPDENYFINRSLDDSGNMYQAENFDFSLREELRQVSDPAYNKKAFETVLDIKQGDSHQNLLDVLTAVNDTDIDIDTTVDWYFDRENLLTWLAMNVILGNEDCVTQSYMIYKPTLSQHWFFLPSNMSNAMPAGGDDRLYPVLQSGYSMFYGNVLYERFLEKPNNAEALITRVDELMEQFSPEYVRRITDQYMPVLSRSLAENPDVSILDKPPEEVLEDVMQYHQTMQRNVQAFHENLTAPRKVELLKPQSKGQDVVFRWEASRQLGGKPLQYELQVAEDPLFEKIIQEKRVGESTEATLSGLPKKWLYWRVIVTDAQGNTAGSVNVTQLEDDSLLYGASGFYHF